MNERERYASTHLWRSRIAECMINDVCSKTGYDITEFLNLPTWLVEHILSTLRQTNTDGRRGAKEIEKQLEKEQQAALDFRNTKQR